MRWLAFGSFLALCSCSSWSSTDSPTTTGGGGGGGGGGGCTASATVNGTMLGSTMQARDALWFSSQGQTGFVVSDFAGACAKANANESVASSQMILFGYDHPTLPAPGTYAVGDTTDWVIAYDRTDATCKPLGDDLAISGTVTIADVSCGVSATFDLTFGGSAGNENEHVTGSFVAPMCVVGTDGGASTCN